MRGTLLVIAGCLLGLSLPAHANWFVVKMSKPNGTWSEFLNDRAACSKDYRTDNWLHTIGSSEHAHQREAEHYYWHCMIARGYTADPKGFRAGTVYYLSVAPRYTTE